jgi:two-component system nitrate/nitrite response regulator NarL
MVRPAVNLVLCDDHRMFVDALALVLEARGWRVVACTVSVGEAARALTTEDVDVCVLDVRFPDGSGVDGISRLLEASPTTKVVMLSATSDRETVARALAAGASGFAAKTSGINSIVDVIAKVAAGELIMEGIDSTPPGPAGAGAHPVIVDYLTARERQVLACMVAGHNTVGLAAELGIAYSTARSHVQNVLMKLGVHSQLQAVAYATAHGLVPLNAGP